jgi:hypothetical protein
MYTVEIPDDDPDWQPEASESAEFETLAEAMTVMTLTSEPDSDGNRFDAFVRCKGRIVARSEPELIGWTLWDRYTIALRISGDLYKMRLGLPQSAALV